MSTLKEEREAIVVEFERRINSTNYEMKEGRSHSLKENTDTLLDESWYPESEYEIDGEKVVDFIRAALLSHEEKVMERVRKEVEGMKVWFMEEDYCNTFPLISKEDLLDNLK